jgi:hypothetical protein
VAVIAPHTEDGKYRFIYKRPDETGASEKRTICDRVLVSRLTTQKGRLG